VSLIKGLKIRSFVIFGLAALSGVALLHTSQRVQEAEERLAQIDRNIAQEQESLKILKAEWEYLNRPERLERLANEFLDLSPPKPLEMPESIKEDAILPEISPQNNEEQPEENGV